MKCCVALAVPRSQFVIEFWAPGDGEIIFSNTIYNFWTANGWVSGTNFDLANPGTGNIPLVNTPELSAKSLVIPAPGRRDQNGTMGMQGNGWYSWPSTPMYAGGYYYHFSNTDQFLVRPGGYQFVGGMSIRCVRP